MNREPITEANLPSSAQSAPLPILGSEESLWRSDGNLQNAPPAVRDVHILCFLMMILSGLGVALGLYVYVLQVSEQSTTVDGYWIAIVSGIVFALYYGLAVAHRKGKRGVWTLQIVLCLLGLFASLLGTAINGLILYKWFRRETKAWYGLD